MLKSNNIDKIIYKYIEKIQIALSLPIIFIIQTLFIF